MDEKIIIRKVRKKTQKKKNIDEKHFRSLSLKKLFDNAKNLIEQAKKKKR